MRDPSPGPGTSWAAIGGSVVPVDGTPLPRDQQASLQEGQRVARVSPGGGWLGQGVGRGGGSGHRPELRDVR